MSIVYCIVIIPGCVLCARFLVYYFVSNALYVVVLLWIVDCEWVCGLLFVALCCYCELNWCVNVASPVRCILSLFYWCSFQLYCFHNSGN